MQDHIGVFCVGWRCYQFHPLVETTPFITDMSASLSVMQTSESWWKCTSHQTAAAINNLSKCCSKSNHMQQCDKTFHKPTCVKINKYCGFHDILLTRQTAFSYTNKCYMWNISLYLLLWSPSLAIQCFVTMLFNQRVHLFTAWPEFAAHG